MALYSKDSETNSLTRTVARLTAESPTETVRGALRERLRQERLRWGERVWDEDTINLIVDRCAALPVLDPRTDDTILGYDEGGLPT